MTTDRILEIPAIHRPEIQQRLFRELLSAMAYVGRIVRLGELLDGERAAIGALACVLDHAVAFADPQGLVDAGRRRFLGARQVARCSEADFALLDGRRPPAPDLAPRLGSIPSPDHSTTLLLEVDRLGSGRRLRLSGPGIDGSIELAIGGLDPAWLEARADWCAAFPLGVDLVLCDADGLACLPRGTRIEELD